LSLDFKEYGSQCSPREYIKLATLIAEKLLSTDFADYRDFSEVVVEDGDNWWRIGVMAWIEFGF